MSCRFLPYLAALSRTAPAPEDFTMAKSVRSNGLRVVRLPLSAQFGAFLLWVYKFDFHRRRE
jgi:hypothetical protein